MKKERGGALVEVVIAMASIILIGVGAHSLMDYQMAKNFKTHVSLKPDKAWRHDPEARKRVQPLVDKQLKELKQRTSDACSAAEALEKKNIVAYNESGKTATPESTKSKPANLEAERERLRKELVAARKSCNDSLRDFGKAKNAAWYYGFEAK